MVMPIFAPPYRPTEQRKPFVIRQQQRQRKRKRDDDSSSDDDGRPALPEGVTTNRIATTTVHPVNRTDPYHVAGHAREELVPPAPFPHAAVEETRAKARPIEQELAELNPPLSVPSTTSREDNSTSLRRRHLDNMTTILHRCMLKGDWPRAYQAWSLLIRTEIGGRGIDVRRNGRWTIGAELLMRKDAQEPRELRVLPDIDEQSTASNADGEDNDGKTSRAHMNAFSDEGFRLARNYYERFIIQYPYTRSSMHSLNATAIYPALFNVWIYEVQDRSQRAQEVLRSSHADGGSDSSDLDVDDATRVSPLYRIKSIELEQALPIADRMDELLISPPYDSDVELKRLRRMVAGWIANLYDHVRAAGDERIDLDRAARERAKASE